MTIVELKNQMTSNCKNCTYSFDAENGWQDFCSVECAREYFTRFKTGAALIQARDDFDGWLANPKNARTVRLAGERAEKPKFGKMVERVFYRESVKGRGKNAIVELIPYRRKVNVGGNLSIRPMTDTERKSAIRQRGRSSFGENMVDHASHKLPSENDNISLGWFDHDF